MQKYIRLMRLDKPTGIHLLFIPCSWSITMASYSHDIPIQNTLYTLALFGAGSVIMRGAGCIINDLWDQKIDRNIKRTESRPLASGEISNKSAILLLTSQLTLGLGVLTQLNTYSILLGMASLPFVAIYPFMKRITDWPQLFLGFTFNWGALLGGSAMVGYCDWNVALPLYLAGIQWTVYYDTIYALQDKLDDIKMGVKSTALRFGSNIYFWLSGFICGTIGFLGIAGYKNGQSWIYFTGLASAASHLIWQMRSLNLKSVQNAAKLFSSNVKTGYLVLGAIALDLISKRIGQFNTHSGAPIRSSIKCKML